MLTVNQHSDGDGTLAVRVVLYGLNLPAIRRACSHNESLCKLGANGVRRLQ
jgi:hypothetical protein